MDYDILVIGAGPAGLSFARAVSDTGLSVGVIEKSPLSLLVDPPYDGREIALTHRSYHTMKDLGQWGLIPDDRISLIQQAKVLNGTSPYALHFDHAEGGVENLGFMISNHLIRRAAYQTVVGMPNVTILTERDVVGVTTDVSGGTVTLSDRTSLRARLIVAADSRFSSTRRMMGIATDMHDFGRTCIVGKMTVTGHHQDTAFECFQFDQTLAVLPLKNAEVSIVITIDTNRADTVMQMDEDEFSADIERRTDGAFGRMTLCTERYSYPLVATYARSFYANRFAVVGDAAVGMHPVTAHGFNLGLRGAVTLAAAIKDAQKYGQDVGGISVLRDYHRAHLRASKAMYQGTNALVKLYTDTSAPAKFARAALLRLGNVVMPAKRLILNQLTESPIRARV
jgi:ubiquinone biosynthesis UbiH/UbiF/VisC/COQ6 family hydroxylase